MRWSRRYSFALLTHVSSSNRGVYHFRTSQPRGVVKRISTMAHALNDVESFASYLQSSNRILALCGAGLSAASGLPTFRGAGGYWRKYEAISLATPGAFQRDPGLVWQFYGYRRHKALQAKPNKAHYALAELARKKPEFLCISQNVDGLSQRAEHPRDSLALLHGTLFDIKCSGVDCNYVDINNFNDPIASALQIDDNQGDLANVDIPMRHIDPSELPHCPKCKQGLLRPGVVWFGETLPLDVLGKVEAYLRDPRGVDLMIVIGTSAIVNPAASFIDSARDRGARIAVINTEAPTSAASALEEGDWLFQDDAAKEVPRILESVIGTIPDQTEKL